jgi:hypothetical protein
MTGVAWGVFDIIMTLSSIDLGCRLAATLISDAVRAVR